MGVANKTLAKKQRDYFTSVLLLDNMVNLDHEYSIMLDGELKLLEPALEQMAVNGSIKLEGSQYVPTDKGIELLTNFKAKIVEFRKVYMHFSAVDMEAGEFAYSRFYDFETDEEFDEYSEEDRFIDIRVAVCQFKKIDPLEIIFLDFVDRGTFDVEESGWEAELMTGLIWDEILEIAENNLQLETILETDGEGTMENVIKAGADVMMTLLKEEAEIAEGEEALEEEEYDDDDEDEVTTTTTTTVEYIDEPVYEIGFFDVYYDPFYVSPCWGYDPYYY